MPIRDVIYRPIRADEAKQVVAVHKSAFRRDTLRRTIFASPKVDRLLACLIAFPEWQREHLFLGAWVADNLVGYAHYRTVDSSLHLNQVAVVPSHQGMGVGQGLLKEWRGMAQQKGLSRITLDVEEDNPLALDWYRRLGLSPIAKTYIYEGRVATGSASAVPEQCGIELVDWENTWAWQRAFGISTIRLRCGAKTWEVGWVRRYFRAREVLPSLVVAVLVRVCPNVRRLFVYADHPLDEKDQPLANMRLVATSVRMEAPI